MIKTKVEKLKKANKGAAAKQMEKVVLSPPRLVPGKNSNL
jgi:hypothetical protein